MKDHPALKTLSELVAINSVNPAYANGRKEEAIQRYILDFFKAAGFPTETQEALPGRPNVIAKLAGRDPSRRLILEAHVDTVGIDDMTISPFEPVLRDGLLYGRGACDAKGGLAAMMHALIEAREICDQPPCDVWLAATVDEEFSYRGALNLCEGLSATGAIIAEPTSLRLVIASKGCLRSRITVNGQAAHSSKPHLGVNAITRMARVLAALEEEEGRLNEKLHPLVGAPTLNVGIIRGGAQVNIVPNECSIEVDRRIVPGETVIEVQARYDQLFDGLRREIPDLKISQYRILEDWPMETAANAHIVQIASAALQYVNLNSKPTGVPFGSDASKLSRIGIPSIVFGPGSIDQAHTADEFVPVDEVIIATQIYKEIIRNF
ncbi:MAG: M20 family metallopeptidase [Chloracidobacterium sp.]|nr:M20 family metallopeptidase [Chloracidobacterium sp.]